MIQLHGASTADESLENSVVDPISLRGLTFQAFQTNRKLGKCFKVNVKYANIAFVYTKWSAEPVPP